MRFTSFANSACAVVLLAVVSSEAKHGSHKALEALHRRHRHGHSVMSRSENDTFKERGLLTCAFPTDAGLVPVTPGLLNGGWAIAPDQTCIAGRYCPYACPPGQVSMQWDPESKSYSYPESMNGGLYCGLDGRVSKPFPDRPYCQKTSASVGVQNNCGSVVSFCQTVLPGDEDMLIPTAVNDFASLAVPDPSYWAATAAHYYINPPGTSASEACVWGSAVKPLGNWSPFVAGANADASGQIFLKLGWNPIYLEVATPFRDDIPDWGVKIDCPNGGCNGLPCSIDPTKNKVNEMTGGSTSGAGGASFCVVTVSKGAQANFVVFKTGDSVNKAGQFYQSNVASGSSQVTSTTTTTSATTTTTSIAVTTTTTASSAIASTTQAATSSHVASLENATTTSYSKTHYALFNTTATSQAVTENVSLTPTATPSHNNAATSRTSSVILILVALALSLI